MTVTAERPNTYDPNPPVADLPVRALGRAEGAELCGEVQGSGYKDGTAMVRRGGGQMVKLGPLMYALLECIDGQRGPEQLAGALSQRIGRRASVEHVEVLSRKLAAVGLLAGTEHFAPPRRNPLLALRWRVLVTNRKLTRWATAPFVFLFRPLLMWPVLLGFGAVLWYVLFEKGLASATSQAFQSPELLLLVFALMVGSAAFHELGHAAACRYGGATPGGMGVGLYLVWPAFYTDVTEAYRLPRRDRLRVDLGGLYFNAVVAVATMLVWLAWRNDALLLLVGLQILLMVKQLSPIIRADGYHILADATGVPDLYAHIGPTLRCLLPWRRREPSALTGWARVMVTAWVLILVPVILSLSATAVLLLPRLATTAWESGRHIGDGIPSQVHQGHWVAAGASVVRLLALLVPLVGSALVTQKVVGSLVARARAWSSGRPARRLLALLAAAGAVATLVWAWWPSGQYQPITPQDHGGVAGIPKLFNPSSSAATRPRARPVQLASRLPVSGVRVSGVPLWGVRASGLSRWSAPVWGVPTSRRPDSAVPGSNDPVSRAAGTRLAITAVPVGGASRANPAYFFLQANKSQPAITIIADSTSTAHGRTTTVPATAFPFNLISSVSEGPNTHAVATNNTNNGVVYEVAYSLVTVHSGHSVTDTNSALAVANCQHCTTVAVSFQVVLIVGQSRTIAPINAAEAVNYHCFSCMTTAVADQIVVTLEHRPTPQLLAQVQAALSRLGSLPSLGSNGTPAVIAAQVTGVQEQIDAALNASGLLPQPAPPPPTESSTAQSTTTSSAGATAPASSGGSAPPSSAAGGSVARTAAPTSPPPSTATAPTSSPPAAPDPASTTAPPLTQAPPASSALTTSAPTTSTPSSTAPSSTATTTTVSPAASPTTP